jgi:hypothetical protein
MLGNPFHRELIVAVFGDAPLVWEWCKTGDPSLRVGPAVAGPGCAANPNRRL